MLVLTRKLNQSIMIGDDIELTVLSVDGSKVRLGIQAPAEVPVFRTEIYVEIQRERGGRGTRRTWAPTSRTPCASSAPRPSRRSPATALRGSRRSRRL